MHMDAELLGKNPYIHIGDAKKIVKNHHFFDA